VLLPVKMTLLTVRQADLRFNRPATALQVKTPAPGRRGTRQAQSRSSVLANIIGPVALAGRRPAQGGVPLKEQNEIRRQQRGIDLELV